jgi:hypothetical protein
VDMFPKPRHPKCLKLAASPVAGMLPPNQPPLPSAESRCARQHRFIPVPTYPSTLESFPAHLFRRLLHPLQARPTRCWWRSSIFRPGRTSWSDSSTPIVRGARLLCCLRRPIPASRKPQGFIRAVPASHGKSGARKPRPSHGYSGRAHRAAPRLLTQRQRPGNRILGPKEDLTDILAKSARKARGQREQ